jgi:small subunit ribosomal protein S21
MAYNRRPQQQKGYSRNKKFNKKFQKKKGPPPFDVLLRQFKKKVERDGIIQECRRREFFVKPSELRQRRKNEAVRKRKRQMEMEKQEWEARRRSHIW